MAMTYLVSEHYTKAQKNPKFKIWFHSNHPSNQMQMAESQLPIEIVL